MKYLDEFRDPVAARKYLDAIHRITTQPWRIMEVCGGQTHAIVRNGLQELLPEKISLLHGPGCPVCVTPTGVIDKALALAARKDVIFCSFGDMLRVPGSFRDLRQVKAEGGDMRIVYSPLDVLEIAQKHPEKEVIFFAVGFETTAPANAMLVYQASQQEITNLSLLVSHVLVPPALKAILAAEDSMVEGFLAAGHVCAIMGLEEYRPIAEKYRVPIVATGFEPLDILQGIHMCIAQLEAGRAEVDNQYIRVVQAGGNSSAQQLIHEIFEIVPQQWRGMGKIPASGLALTEQYRQFDAEHRFTLSMPPVKEHEACLSGEILRGVKKPAECPAFGSDCTPEHPLGATMVSDEGACSAYYRYRTKAVA